jgi:magnesium transporter
MRVWVWQDGKPVEEPGNTIVEVCRLLDDGDRPFGEGRTTAWLHVTTDELPDVAGHFNFQPQAVEDALKSSRRGEPAQRTKLDRYANHAFMYLHMTYLNRIGGLETEGLPVFTSRRVVVSVARGDRFDPDEAVRRWQRQIELLKHGTSTVLYYILDIVVDSHLDALDALSARIDRMEDLLFDAPADLDPRKAARSAFATRKAVIGLRRVATPMHEVVAATMRKEEEDQTPVDDALMPYYQDVYDHSRRVDESVEDLRDLLSSIYDTRVSISNHTLNDVTKKLASWAAIFAVPTAVTGFYGQNVRYPGFGTTWGFAVSTVIWVSVAGLLYFSFRSRHWL